jgi:predicted DNA-binding protein (UPF0278 family)
MIKYFEKLCDYFVHEIFDAHVDGYKGIRDKIKEGLRKQREDELERKVVISPVSHKLAIKFKEDHRNYLRENCKDSKDDRIS